MARTEPGADDRQLVDSFLRHRGEGPFRALYRRYTPRLFQLSLRILAGDDRDAEEAVQETWIRAAERLEAFAWRSSLGTWLTGIAINVCRDRLRRRRSRIQPVPLARSEIPEPVGSDRSKDKRVDLERAIARLAPRYRQVLVLHDVEGYTHREISNVLDIEVGTSKSQLHQARRAMRERLEALQTQPRKP